MGILSGSSLVGHTELVNFAMDRAELGADIDHFTMEEEIVDRFIQCANHALPYFSAHIKSLKKEIEKEGKSKISEQRDQKLAELNALKAKEPEMIWLDDLDELENKLNEVEDKERLEEVPSSNGTLVEFKVTEEIIHRYEKNAKRSKATNNNRTSGNDGTLTVKIPELSTPDNSGVIQQIAVEKTAPAVQATAQQATATSPMIGRQVPVGSGGGVRRTQITDFSPTSVQSQTSIARPVTPTTYMPMAGATATSIQSQRLSTPTTMATKVQPSLTITQQQQQPRKPNSGTTRGTTTVIPSSGALSAVGGDTVYFYESVPTSVPLSAGGHSLTITTVMSGGVCKSQIVTLKNLETGIVTNIPCTPSQNVATAVQITAGSTSWGTQRISHIQEEPLRFNPQHITEQPVSVAAANSVNAAQPHHQIIKMTQAQQQPIMPRRGAIVAKNSAPLFNKPHHQIIKLTQAQQQTIMPRRGVIVAKNSAPLFNKPHHQIIKLTQAQQQTIMPRRGVIVAKNSAPLFNKPHHQIIKQQQQQPTQQDHMLIPPVQTTPKKRPVTAIAAAASPLRPIGVTPIGTVNTERRKERERDGERPSTPPQSRPGSSGDLTKVGANSSPGVDQQMTDEINSMQLTNVRVTNESHFNQATQQLQQQQDRSESPDASPKKRPKLRDIGSNRFV